MTVSPLSTDASARQRPRPACSTSRTTSPSRPSGRCSSQRPTEVSAGSRSTRSRTARRTGWPRRSAFASCGHQADRPGPPAARRVLRGRAHAVRAARRPPAVRAVQPRDPEAARPRPARRDDDVRRTRRAAGRPQAARAVGTVMNRNPIPIVLPCHRVVGANGSLTGYAGGLERKELLLKLEGALDGTLL